MTTTPAKTIALHLTDHHQQQLLKLAWLLAFGPKEGMTLRAIANSYKGTNQNAILVRLYQLESLGFVTVESRLNAPNLYHWKAQEDEECCFSSVGINQSTALPVASNLNIQ